MRRPASVGALTAMLLVGWSCGQAHAAEPLSIGYALDIGLVRTAHGGVSVAIRRPSGRLRVRSLQRDGTLGASVTLPRAVAVGGLPTGQLLYLDRRGSLLRARATGTPGAVVLDAGGRVSDARLLVTAQGEAIAVWVRRGVIHAAGRSRLGSWSTPRALGQIKQGERLSAALAAGGRFVVGWPTRRRTGRVAVGDVGSARPRVIKIMGSVDDVAVAIDSSGRVAAAISDRYIFDARRNGAYRAVRLLVGNQRMLRNAGQVERAAADRRPRVHINRDGSVTTVVNRFKAPVPGRDLMVIDRRSGTGQKPTRYVDDTPGRTAVAVTWDATDQTYVRAGLAPVLVRFSSTIDRIDVLPELQFTDSIDDMVVASGQLIIAGLRLDRDTRFERGVIQFVSLP
jgi:hypothetical protein